MKKIHNKENKKFSVEKKIAWRFQNYFQIDFNYKKYFKGL